MGASSSTPDAYPSVGTAAPPHVERKKPRFREVAVSATSHPRPPSPPPPHASPENGTGHPSSSHSSGAAPALLAGQSSDSFVGQSSDSLASPTTEHDEELLAKIRSRSNELRKSSEELEELISHLHSRIGQEEEAALHEEMSERRVGADGRHLHSSHPSLADVVLAAESNEQHAHQGHAHHAHHAHHDSHRRMSRLLRGGFKEASMSRAGRRITRRATRVSHGGHGGNGAMHAAHARALDEVRLAVLAIQQTSERASRVIMELTPERDATTRADNLLSLEELIGPKPSRTWQDEWVPLVCEFHRTTGRPVDKQCPPISEMSEAALAEYVERHMSIDTYSTRIAEDVTAAVEYGWPRDRADIFLHAQLVKAPIARALRFSDDCYAASTYALCDAFFDQAESVSRAQRGLPPRLYTHLRGRGGLAFNEPGWEQILEPDHTGFRGHTCSSLVTADCDPDRIDAAGHKAFNPDPAVMRLEAVQSEIVCFEPRHDDEHGAHTAVMFADMYGAFPPNTLFRLKTIHEPGTWKGPGGTQPMQKLIVVTATYRKATRRVKGKETKMASDSITLSYGDRERYVKGLSELLTRPTLTMPLEFDRDVEWIDWKGVSYTLRDEWKYVIGPAVPRPECTPGCRDEFNKGKTPDDFLREVNTFIKDRRARDYGTSMLESDALLTRDEVLSVRLYSGPAYQPINTFLREVSHLSDDYKLMLARHPRLTFCQTISHIIAAIRKLAAVATPEEATMPLWRGVRGELPRGFWVPDKANMVCGVEMAFMSTSRNIGTPLDYMDQHSNNVMWALKPMLETDEGYHIGADVAMLSQFASEAEVLFPPCTLLIVQAQKVPSDDAAAAASPPSPERTMATDLNSSDRTMSAPPSRRGSRGNSTDAADAAMPSAPVSTHTSPADIRPTFSPAGGAFAVRREPPATLQRRPTGEIVIEPLAAATTSTSPKAGPASAGGASAGLLKSISGYFPTSLLSGSILEEASSPRVTDDDDGGTSLFEESSNKILRGLTSATSGLIRPVADMINAGTPRATSATTRTFGLPPIQPAPPEQSDHTAAVTAAPVSTGRATHHHPPTLATERCVDGRHFLQVDVLPSFI